MPEHRPVVVAGGLGQLVQETFQQLSLRAQKAGTVLAGPPTGDAAPPQFQALADLLTDILAAYQLTATALTQALADIRYLRQSVGHTGAFASLEGWTIAVQNGQIISLGAGEAHYYTPQGYLPQICTPRRYTR
jgi:hypothetical protein